MWDFRPLSHVLVLFIFQLLVALVSSAGPGTRTGWKTFQGSPPLVIARGGFSGTFPDSSFAAYSLAVNTSVPNVILWCDVQLTKDGVGICLPDIKLDNATDISIVYPGEAKLYLVDGVLTQGWFSSDYTLRELASVSVLQGIFSRTERLDRNQYPILTVEDVFKLVKPPSPGLWLNVQHDAFINQQKLSTRRFLLSLFAKGVSVSYISSPDVGFLRRMRSVISPRTTKLVFRFLEENKIEPATNQTYGSLLKNLKDIRTFADGILVTKGYIWPVDPSLYLQPHTCLVSDAHREGLQVFVSDLVNDVPFSYNFSYDPLAECLSFIDNGKFSVDGVLSDFPITPSAAINCFSGLGENAPKQVETLVISKYGASGDFPACTDLAYKKAIFDGADVIDCPVQMSKDGIPFCLSSIDLTESTTVARSKFRNLQRIIPEIKPGSGIYTFALTWNEIKTLTPSMLNPYENFTLYRNPKFRNQGMFLTLSDFLSLTNGRTTGLLISIENAAYLAEKQGLSVTNAVLNALQKAGYDKPGRKKIMIQSTHSSVLKIFNGKSNYEKVYKVDKSISDAVDSAVQIIKTFADSVVVGKESVLPETSAFLVYYTNIVKRLQSFDLPVYVETFSNEFVSQAWDFYSSAFVEINSFVQGAKVNGIVTDFPKTADRYRRNKCLKMGEKPAYMSPVEPGKLLKQIPKVSLPRPPPSLPVLTVPNVTEPPLAPVSV
ncbi:glycerophosphodiester phosphodiesterase GDPDL3-like [Gastrolobium bilobum]|uniref:glycerophosphodiester phosphodiesterase GDPDL3-like n=1 Tax=Gastrolobium bilobum TaxID=150636 RepID=UPI002AB2F07D|nr:glycerophosphodiester phosphodiesterase GDPDL3-like [Gastrolobium bilobum]